VNTVKFLEKAIDKLSSILTPMHDVLLGTNLIPYIYERGLDEQTIRRRGPAAAYIPPR
jgi:hypothetical protein